MLLEADKQRLQEELEESRREVQKHVKEVQVLQARLKDAVTWDEHCSLTGKLRRCKYFSTVLVHIFVLAFEHISERKELFEKATKMLTGCTFDHYYFNNISLNYCAVSKGQDKESNHCSN